MDQEEEVEASILPPSSPHIVPAKRKRHSKASTMPSVVEGEDAAAAAAAAPGKPKKKRAKTIKGSDVPATGAVDANSLRKEQLDARTDVQDDTETSVVMAGPNTIRIKRPKRPVETVTTTEMIMDELEDERRVPVGSSERAGKSRSRRMSHDSWGTPPPMGHEDADDVQAGHVPPPLSDQSLPSNPLTGSTPFTLPPPPVIASSSSKSEREPGFYSQLRKNIMRNLVFKGDPKVPFANSGSPPVGSPRAAERNSHLSPETDTARSSARYTPARSQGDETERSYLGGGDSRAASEEPGHPRSDSPMETGEHDGPRSNDQDIRRAQWDTAPDWTPPQSEVDPYDNPELQGQYKTAFRPEPPKKKAKKKRAIRPAVSLNAGDATAEGSLVERSGLEQEGTPAGTENGDGVAPVKKKKKSVKPLMTDDPNNIGTWRRGLKKGQTRADAIAMFKENNPGKPLPPGWDFPTNPPEKPVVVRTISFKKEPPPPPPEPKGDILSYVPVEQTLGSTLQPRGASEEVKQEIVLSTGPSRPVATAMKIDITKADETDFEKLGIEIGEPLQDPEAVATPENVGHPVFRHHVEMRGLPVLKAVDPSKSLKEHDIVCPRELKENLTGHSRKFEQKELAVTGIGGYSLKFKTWSGEAGKSSWRTSRDERVAEQLRVAEEAMINDPPVLGPEGTPMAGVEGTFDETGQFVPITPAGPAKGKRGGLTKLGKQRKAWTKKTEKGDASKRILDSLKQQEGSPSVMGTPDMGTAAVNSEVASSPAPMPELDDAAVSQADYSRPPSPMPGLSVAGDDVDAEMEDLL